MIVEAIAFFFDPAPRAIPAPTVIEARWRRRARYRNKLVITPLKPEGPKTVRAHRVMQGPDGKWFIIPGLEDVYSRVPPFNRSKP